VKEKKKENSGNSNSSIFNVQSSRFSFVLSPHFSFSIIEISKLFKLLSDGWRGRKRERSVESLPCENVGNVKKKGVNV
jgi:hypothetical protein